MADLIFGAAAAASTPDLVFGADTTLRTAGFAVTMPAPGGGIVAAQEIPAAPFAFAVTMAAPGGSVALQYDLGVPDYLGPTASAAWRDADARRAGLSTTWAGGAYRSADAGLSWRQCEARRPAPTGLPWQQGDVRRPAPTALPWRQGDALRPAPTGLPWQQGAERRPNAVGIAWRDGERVRVARNVAWRDGAAWRAAHGFAWRQARSAHVPRRAPWRDGAPVETHGNNPWPPVIPPEPDHCYESSTHLVFDWAPAADARLLFACDYYIPGGPPAAIVIPVRSVYIVNNTVLLSVVGGDPLSPTSLSMALDADSWTWRWSATLPAADLARVDTGAPVEVLASVNGIDYRLVVEQIGSERSFGRTEIRVSGRGRNAILDVLAGTFDNAAAARTAAQLMDDALLVGGDGWTVDFGLDDWLVPAGVWSAQGTAIDALRAIAAAAGGYLQPHRTGTVVRVLPRYAVAPWGWGSVTPDIELPTAPVVRESVEWVSRAEYNRVFVSGTRDGVLAQVTRTGTAGDVVAPMVTDALITEAVAGRQRGLSILGDTGRQQLVTLSLPVLPATGVIEPGKFIRYTDGANVRRGVVRSTSIEARFPSLTQTIGVETHA